MAEQDKNEIDELERAKQQAADIEAELEKERKRVEDEFRQKKKEAEERVLKLQRERAKPAHDEIVRLAREFQPYLTLAQRNQIIRILKPETTGDKRSDGQKSEGKKLPPKYEVYGKTWTGRGRRPPEFKEWEEKEGKQWRAKNPGQKYPPVQG